MAIQAGITIYSPAGELSDLTVIVNGITYELSDFYYNSSYNSYTAQYAALGSGNLYKIMSTGYRTIEGSIAGIGDIEETLTPTPSNLYAYTDPNVTGTPLYAWTCNDGVDISTVYTTDAIPTSASRLYDENMNDITALITAGSLAGAQIADADANTLTVGFTAVGHNGGSNE